MGGTECDLATYGRLQDLFIFKTLAGPTTAWPFTIYGSSFSEYKNTHC